LMARLMTPDGAGLLPSVAAIPSQGADIFAAFSLGTMVGQAEKVFLGAARVCIIRPAREWHAWARCAMDMICGHYGLVVLEYAPLEELWGVHADWVALAEHCHTLPYPSAESHRLRGRLCGIPEAQIDGAYHQRATHGARWEPETSHQGE
jgi:hypothetical protein